MNNICADQAKVYKKLHDMRGLGPKSEGMLREVGIYTPSELLEIGAVRAFIKLRRDGSEKPGLNFLYALVGAIEDRHWLDVAKKDKGRLLLALEGYAECQALLQNEPQ